MVAMEVACQQSGTVRFVDADEILSSVPKTTREAEKPFDWRIRFEPLFTGTIDDASVHPREVVKRALAHNAAAVILAHNHPSGVPEPSTADMALTRRLTEALGLVDIRVLDHIVVGGAETVSFAERGWH